MPRRLIQFPGLAEWGFQTQRFTITKRAGNGALDVGISGMAGGRGEWRRNLISWPRFSNSRLIPQWCLLEHACCLSRIPPGLFSIIVSHVHVDLVRCVTSSLQWRRPFSVAPITSGLAWCEVQHVRALKSELEQLFFEYFVDEGNFISLSNRIARDSCCRVRWRIRAEPLLRFSGASEQLWEI